ncbi:hypothetical protein JHK82_023625 [Glycine max]|nr:hypothetical protein JHK87_023575 [Glycine soja]KAG5005641.1 hypothetical protein JHK85_024183 [Glycine max]KAG5132437.1 hypothetical protein JHK82_023625 [Glycine max]
MDCVGQLQSLNPQHHIFGGIHEHVENLYVLEANDSPFACLCGGGGYEGGVGGGYGHGSGGAGGGNGGFGGGVGSGNGEFGGAAGAGNGVFGGGGMGDGGYGGGICGEFMDQLRP